jgi:hypothetical protein
MVRWAMVWWAVRRWAVVVRRPMRRWPVGVMRGTVRTTVVRRAVVVWWTMVVVAPSSAPATTPRPSLVVHPARKAGALFLKGFGDVLAVNEANVKHLLQAP